MRTKGQTGVPQVQRQVVGGLRFAVCGLWFVVMLLLSHAPKAIMRRQTPQKPFPLFAYTHSHTHTHIRKILLFTVICQSQICKHFINKSKILNMYKFTVLSFNNF